MFASVQFWLFYHLKSSPKLKDEGYFTAVLKNIAHGL
jgi:hypothetical protein